MIYLVIFLLCILAMAHTYVLYPWLLSLKAGNRVLNRPAYTTNDDLPMVSVLVAGYNEEKVIGQKLESVYNQSYPADKIEVLVGSDASTDGTDDVVRTFADKGCKLIRFDERTGKPGVINQLAEQARGDILILTDANIMLGDTTIMELARYFKDPSVGLVEGRIGAAGKESGVEASYVSREVWIKHLEGVQWGTTIGPLGGCYAVRRTNYNPVPPTYLVDDFYIAMSVFEQGNDAVTNLSAVSTEEVTGSLREEFRRMVRIATGNWQNLARFNALLFSSRKGLSYSFFSHKVLRWLGPFLLVLLYFCGWKLAGDPVFFDVFRAMLFLLLIPVFDGVLAVVGIRIRPLRFISYFFGMNLALFIGFFRYIKGVRSNVWQPTRR